jgi:hypothetical protein
MPARLRSGPQHSAFCAGDVFARGYCRVRRGPGSLFPARRNQAGLPRNRRSQLGSSVSFSAYNGNLPIASGLIAPGFSPTLRTIPEENSRAVSHRLAAGIELRDFAQEWRVFAHSPSHTDMLWRRKKFASVRASVRMELTKFLLPPPHRHQSDERSGPVYRILALAQE